MATLYDKYYGILKNIYNIMDLTDNKELKELSKNTIIDLVNQLCKKDNINKKAYQRILEEFGLQEKIEEEKKSYIQSEKEEVSLVEEQKNINNSEKEEIFEIKKIKRSYNSELKNKALSLLALSGIKLTNPLFKTGVGVGGYHLYKRGIKSLKSLIEKKGLKIDEDDNLIDSEGKILKEEEIGELKYALIKRGLSILNDNGRIDKNYKKNKLTSMLLKVPSNMFISIKNNYNKIKVNKETENIEIEDMNKGLEKVK